MKRLPRNQLLVGDARACLDQLPAASVDCVVTSPPDYLPRNYGVPGQIGLEGAVDGWVSELRLVMSGVARVLKPGGALWLNVGDRYSVHPRYGAPAKSMLGAPERLLLGLMDDGWLVRNKVIWAKPNPTPASVTDRLNTTYEALYFWFAHRDTYSTLMHPFPHRSVVRKRDGSDDTPIPTRRTLMGRSAGREQQRTGPPEVHRKGRQRQRQEPRRCLADTNVWVSGCALRHLPGAVVYRPILSTCPEAVCTRCKRPLRREATLRTGPQASSGVDLRYPATWLSFRAASPLRACGCGDRPGPA